MNKIDTTQAVDPTSLQPFTTKSLAFLQNATQEALQGALRAIVGDLNWTQITVPGGIALGGLVVSGNNLGEGFIVASETGNIEEAEVFYYPGQNGVLAYATPQFELLTTNDAVADPVEFSDAVSKNVHNIRRLTVTNTGLGTGMFNYVDMINLHTAAGGALTYGAGWSTLVSATVKYRIAPQNILMIKGTAQYTWPVGAPQLVIGTLPAGAYRPLTTKDFVVQVFNSTTSGWTTGDITINTTGTITYGPHVVHAAADVIYVFLDNISIFTQW